MDSSPHARHAARTRSSAAKPRCGALVDRFYDLMDETPEFYVIRKLHPQDLAGSREKLFMFLSGWLGGPPLYVEKHGHPMLRARHLPFRHRRRRARRVDRVHEAGDGGLRGRAKECGSGCCSRCSGLRTGCGTAGVGSVSALERRALTVCAFFAIASATHVVPVLLVVHALHDVPHAERLHALVALLDERPAVDDLVDREIGAKADLDADRRDRLLHRGDDRRILGEVVEQDRAARRGATRGPSRS